jgi:cytochrome c553
MGTLLSALLLLPLLQSGNTTPVVRANAGKAAWDARLCRMCHGNQGQGGYGPDLAGRGLTFAQYKRAVRKPWGVMPAFTERQVSDPTLAEIAAYLLSLPRVAEPAEWLYPAPPPDAPRGQILLIGNGCGQCHQPELRSPRMVLGGQAVDVDFAFFAKRVYNHTDIYPDGMMGNFSRLRLPESILQEIYRFAIHDLGLLVPISAEIASGVPAGENTTYTLTIKNEGIKGKGLSAKDVTILLILPAGSKMVSATGRGYEGIRLDSQTKSDAAVWQIPRVAPEEEQLYTLTLSGTSGAPANIFKGSVVRWAKPEIRKGAPDLVLRDPRMPGRVAQTPVTFPGNP